jgi:hypothetical protein
MAAALMEHDEQILDEADHEEHAEPWLYIVAAAPVPCNITTFLLIS